MSFEEGPNKPKRDLTMTVWPYLTTKSGKLDTPEGEQEIRNALNKENATPDELTQLITILFNSAPGTPADDVRKRQKLGQIIKAHWASRRTEFAAGEIETAMRTAGIDPEATRQSLNLAVGGTLKMHSGIPTAPQTVTPAIAAPAARTQTHSLEDAMLVGGRLIQPPTTEKVDPHNIATAASTHPLAARIDHRVLPPAPVSDAVYHGPTTVKPAAKGTVDQSPRVIPPIDPRKVPTMLVRIIPGRGKETANFPALAPVLGLLAKLQRATPFELQNATEGVTEHDLYEALVAAYSADPVKMPSDLMNQLTQAIEGVMGRDKTLAAQIKFTQHHMQVFEALVNAFQTLSAATIDLNKTLDPGGMDESKHISMPTPQLIPSFDVVENRIKSELERIGLAILPSTRTKKTTLIDLQKRVGTTREQNDVDREFRGGYQPGTNIALFLEQKVRMETAQINAKMHEMARGPAPASVPNDLYTAMTQYQRENARFEENRKKFTIVT